MFRRQTVITELLLAVEVLSTKRTIERTGYVVRLAGLCIA